MPAAKTDSRSLRGLRVIPVAASLLVAAGSFALSFYAQGELAANLGVAPARLAWVFPVICDGAVISASASIWVSSMRGVKQHIVPWLVLVSMLTLSVVVNIAHSWNGNVLAGVMAAAPPIVLLGCLEIAALQFRATARDEQAAAQPERAAAPVVASAPAAPVTRRAVPAPVRLPAPAPAFDAALHARPAAATVAPASAEKAPLVVAEPVEKVAPAPENPTPTVAATPPPEAPKAPNAATKPPRGLTSARVREAYSEHLASGGEVEGPDVVKKIAELTGAPLPSVRRTLAAVRQELAAV